MLTHETTPAIQLSDWIVIDGYCAMRIIKGTNPKLLENRVAFIEKTPRVRTNPFSDRDSDLQNWTSGPKGEGGSGDAESEAIYGFYPPSRQWCDEQLILLGYSL